MFSLRQLRRFLLVLSFSSVMFGYTTVKTLNNIRFADQYAWSQTLSTAITVGANTVTLSPCPSGVNGTDIAPTPHWLYLTSGTGDSSPSEPVLITGGSCVGAALSGTVTFVAAFSHCISGHSGCTSSVSIGTATGGAQEAERDAGTANANVNNWIILAPGMTFQFNAPLFLSQSSISLGGNGSNVKCNLLNRCIMMGDTASSVTWVGQRIEALQITPGTPIWSSPIFPSSPSSIATPAPAGTAPNPGTSASISSITGNGSNAMVTTSGTQPFIVGETVTIIGSNVPGYNVTTTILTATSSSFTFSSSITTTAGPYGFAALPLTLTFSASSPCPSSFYPQIPNQVLWLAGTGPGAGSAPTAGDPTTPYGIGEFVNVLGGTCAPTGTGTIVIAQGTPGLTQLNAHGSGYSLSNTVSPGIEDNAEGSDLENIYFRSANSGAVRFGSGIQIDNDQAAVIHALEFNSGDAPILNAINGTAAMRSSVQGRKASTPVSLISAIPTWKWEGPEEATALDGGAATISTLKNPSVSPTPDGE